MSLQQFRSNPPVESCRLLDFDPVEMIDTQCGPVLRVRGRAPCLNMTVSLLPRIYVDCPEW